MTTFLLSDKNHVSAKRYFSKEQKSAYFPTDPNVFQIHSYCTSVSKERFQRTINGKEYFPFFRRYVQNISLTLSAIISSISEFVFIPLAAKHVSMLQTVAQGKVFIFLLKNESSFVSHRPQTD